MSEKLHIHEPVILFDGVCNLCNGFVNFIIKTDKRAEIKFLALQNPKAQALLKGFPESKMLIRDLSTVILVENKNLYFKSDAVLHISAYLPFPWRVFKVFRFIPGFLRDKIYDYVAQHRYAWFGKKPHCMVPSPDVIARFIV